MNGTDLDSAKPHHLDDTSPFMSAWHVRLLMWHMLTAGICLKVHVQRKSAQVFPFLKKINSKLAIFPAQILATEVRKTRKLGLNSKIFCPLKYLPSSKKLGVFSFCK